MNRSIIVVVVFAVVVAACSSGPAAPAIGESQTVCNDAFCIDVPQGWVVDVGEGYVAANHELDGSNTFLTAGVINLEAIVVNAGGIWPQPTAQVARDFWKLLEDAGVGSFERSRRVVGGAERTWGTHEDGVMWHLVYPTGGNSGIGIELRAPNDSWESHADFVFASVEVRP
ncbi:MAG: hypothetical protein O3B42_00430 [Actinomycetota bacterium]|nr:hypothetical protein [Actinomycetota bacterium]